MNYRPVGTTNISVSEIGLGCWAIGGPNWEKGSIPSGWSPINDNDALNGIAYAIDHGITHFDNADCYGDGRAEQLLGKAIQSHSNDVVVSSKVGWINSGFDHPYCAENIRHQCETTLQNLKRDYVDIYYFHHGDFGRSDQYLSEAITTMHQLKTEGKIRAIGLSTYSQKQFKRLIPRIKPDAVQCWAHLMDYHFIAKNSTLQNLCKEYKISIIGFQPLNQGILLDKYDPHNPPLFGKGDHRSGLQKFSKDQLLDTHERLVQLKDKYGESIEELAAIAFRFVLNHQSVASTLVGFRNKKQVRENLTCSKVLNGSDMSYLYNLFRK